MNFNRFTIYEGKLCSALTNKETLLIVNSYFCNGVRCHVKRSKIRYSSFHPKAIPLGWVLSEKSYIPSYTDFESDLEVHSISL